MPGLDLDAIDTRLPGAWPDEKELYSSPLSIADLREYLSDKWENLKEQLTRYPPEIQEALDEKTLRLTPSDEHILDDFSCYVRSHPNVRRILIEEKRNNTFSAEFAARIEYMVAHAQPDIKKWFRRVETFTVDVYSSHALFGITAAMRAAEDAKVVEFIIHSGVNPRQVAASIVDCIQSIPNMRRFKLEVDFSRWDVQEVIFLGREFHETVKMYQPWKPTALYIPAEILAYLLNDAHEQFLEDERQNPLALPGNRIPEWFGRVTQLEVYPLSLRSDQPIVLTPLHDLATPFASLSIVRLTKLDMDECIHVIKAVGRQVTILDLIVTRQESMKELEDLIEAISLSCPQISRIRIEVTRCTTRDEFVPWTPFKNLGRCRCLSEFRFVHERPIQFTPFDISDIFCHLPFASEFSFNPRPTGTGTIQAPYCSLKCLASTPVRVSGLKELGVLLDCSQPLYPEDVQTAIKWKASLDVLDLGYSQGRLVDEDIVATRAAIEKCFPGVRIESDGRSEWVEKLADTQPILWKGTKPASVPQPTGINVVIPDAVQVEQLVSHPQ
ncbi:hypothetical protein K474DRAFT_1675443 [Panus rudis PR-1116 ss-1]|nr:hypothetical protein K474DRAFT_1675443 [Panus rudis PR-1116 ss-1]